MGWSPPPRLGVFPSCGCSPFILPLCCSLSPMLWPFPLPSPGGSVPVSVRWRLLCRAALDVAWGVVVLVPAVCRSWVPSVAPFVGVLLSPRVGAGGSWE